MPNSASNEMLLNIGACKRQVHLLSFPKPFIGHIATIQFNAFASWSLIPGINIYVAGDDEGIEEACQMFGFTHIKNVPTSNLKTPYLNPVFDWLAGQSCANDIIVYVNADIVLQPSLLALIDQLKYADYLVAARRYNIDINERLDRSAECFLSLQKQAIGISHISKSFSSDIFILPVQSPEKEFSGMAH